MGENDRYLHHLTDGNFPTTVLDSKAAWMILAVDNAHLNTLLPTWLALVNRTRNAVRVGLVHAGTETAVLRQLNVTEVPAVRYVKAGDSKAVWNVYSGNMTEEKLTEFSLTLLHSRFVKSIRGEEGLIDLMSGFVDTPRILLFSKHNQVPPLLQSLSIDYHPDLRFALASFADPVLTKKFDIKKAPSFVALAQLESSKGSVGGQLELVAGSYDQDTKWEALVHWLDEVRANGVVNEGMPEEVKVRYRMGRKKMEADRKEREKEEAKARRKAEAEAEKERAALFDAAVPVEDTASCEVTPGDDSGTCTAP